MIVFISEFSHVREKFIAYESSSDCVEYHLCVVASPYICNQYIINPFNASWSILLLFEGSSAILV